MANLYFTDVHVEPAGSKDHEKITKLKWSLDGKTGDSALADLVKWVDTAGNNAYVTGTNTQVFVVDGSTKKYLRSAANSTYNDNLINLPKY